MEEIEALIDAKLMVLVPVLYLLGMALKKSPVRDWLIPYLLAAAGATLSFAYFLGVGTPGDASGWFRLAFSAVTQGALCAACNVYVKNLWKQFKEKRKQDENDIPRENGKKETRSGE